MDADRTCHHSISGVVWWCLAIVLTLATTAGATPGEVLSHQKISDTQGGFTGTLEDDDRFGTSVASLGDLDGDGVGDLAVGALGDDDGGSFRGAVWVLFLNTDGTVKSHQKISDTQGGFTGGLDDFDNFGNSVASLGDLDGDGVDDLALGLALDGDGGRFRGAVWVLFLDGVPDECFQAVDNTPCADDGVECTIDVCFSEVCVHISPPALRSATPTRIVMSIYKILQCSTDVPQGQWAP